jgi:hypothetical protein
VATRPMFRLIGERGPEAVVPLHKIAQLGGGAGGGAPTVNVTINGGDMDAEAIVRATEIRVGEKLRSSAWYRDSIKRTARRGM